ncbi:hypothetical protein CBR_g6435 [Chara braunii]|uniref:Apple domain-containing protein n=1 Tax=Chara braunii TaxID=69332 RepID=A0A388KJZ0_CHABU|nr:hypothetical protein CBR_g6435 [Chara braunii]|eukprot:GBG70308.1 hypothetical protein CBR_g6435 [Chara braunii]
MWESLRTCLFSAVGRGSSFHCRKKTKASRPAMKPSMGMAALAAVAFLLLVALYQPTVEGAYLCNPGKDQNEYTYKKINCLKVAGAVSYEGCRDTCGAEGKCKGFVHAAYDWSKGKYCCFLKSKVDESKFRSQAGRETCRKLDY